MLARRKQLISPASEILSKKALIRKNSIHKTKKVLVALSGGVDSAVSAAQLTKRGFEIVGVFFHFGPWGKNSLKNAKKITKKLNIPLKIVDARREFKKKIIDYFIESYKKGITPNPCVVCNKKMKFRLLFKLLKKLKADYIATGHYARITRQGFDYKLLEAEDKTKDQPYFLYRLTQKELAKIIFPLGDFKKTEVKKMAKKFGLPVSGEEESQDICFLSGTDINSFLKRYIKPKYGNIVDEKKNILGKHKGLPFYTISQRKGIEIGGTGPYFVIAKNTRKNELIVSSDQKKLLVKKFEVDQVNWVDKGNWGNKGKRQILRARVQIRYHAEKISAIIKSGKAGRLVVETKKPLRAVTPGQSAVFYKGDEVLGGGIII